MKGEIRLVQEGGISGKVFRWGLFLSLGMILAGVIQLSCSGPSGGNSKKVEGSAVVRLPIKQTVSHPPICGGANNTALSGKDNSARQLQNWSCLSGLVTLPSDLEMGSLWYSFPGTTEIYECRKRNDQDCFLVKEVTVKEAGRPIVFPTRMRLRGDPGEARFKFVE